jgi:hypothetical protein
MTQNEAVNTFYETTVCGIKGYYSIGKSPIKYDITVSLNEALNLRAMRVGPEHCQNCDIYGSIRGVFIGCCSTCALRAYRENTCECYLVTGSVAELLEEGHKGCDGDYCKIKNVLHQTLPEYIGMKDYKQTTHNYCYDRKGNTHISTHIRFHDEDDDEQEDGNNSVLDFWDYYSDECSSNYSEHNYEDISPKLSLINPEYLVSESPVQLLTYPCPPRVKSFSQ